ncbi:MAG: CPBP family glutamic-type intramembrane protease [Candidatus Nanopelagicales bacterium]
MTRHPGQISIVSSALVQAAGIAVRLTRWWLAYPLAFLMVIIAALIVSPVAPAFDSASLSLVRQIPVILLHAVLLALIVAWIKWWEQRPTRTVGFLGAGRRDVLRGFGLGAAVAFGIVVVLLMLGSVHLTPAEGGPVRWGALLPALVMVVVWLFLAAVQEALSRGFLLQVTGLQISAWAAITGQAVLWAIVRAAARGDIDVMTLANLVLVGVVLALVALKRGSLWLVVGLQAGWSWLESTLLGMAAIGGPDPVLHLVPTSASWLSGGAAGPLASPVVTLVLIVVGVRLALRYQHLEIRAVH